MKKIFTLLFLLIYIAGFSQSTTVVISQVYPGGGSSAAGVLYKYDYVELHNISTITQDISNFSLQYGSATGNLGGSATQIYGIQANTTIPAGGYLLIQMGAAGTAGADLPVTPDFISANVNLGGTSGKIALTNISVGLGCGATATPCTLPSVNIIDLVAWGTSNNAEGGATVGTTSITTGAVRKGNGCQDTDNNLTDFDIISNPVPRNSATAVAICGALGPILSAGPAITNLTTTVGVASVAASYNLSGTNLTGFPGNITVTASANLEVSLSSSTGFAGSINVPYTSASLAATPIYVRISSTAAQGAVSGTITNSGGGAPLDVTVPVTGGVYQNYYNTKADLGLTAVGTWSSTVNGLGASPADFTTAYQLFNIINQDNANYSGVWNVTAAGNTARIVVGDGITAMDFTILPDADSLTSATRIDVLNNATLTLQNNRRPFLNNMANGSTVNFAQTGTTSADTIRIPAISYYNLKLTGGLKYFSANTTTIRGNLTADAVVSMNGSSPTFSTINAFGNLSFINGSKFESLPSGDGARITLAMNGNAAQTITGAVNDTIYLFRLQRDTTSSNGTINLAGNLNLALGNASGGGLRLNQGVSTTTILNMPGAILSIIGAGVVTPASTGKINSTWSDIYITKTAGTSNAGTLRFTSGSILNLLNINFGPAFSRDSVIIADSVSAHIIDLLKGKVIVSSGAVLSAINGQVTGGVIITGGSANSFVEGKLRKAGLTTTASNQFPVGKGSKYAPVDIPVASGDFTVEYFYNPYGNNTIDPVTLGTYPAYNISQNEYWQIDRASSSSNPDITFYYTDAGSGIIDPTQIKIAHFDGADWNDLGGTAGITNTLTNGTVTVTGVSTFSPFTFAARTAGVIPVKLNSFSIQKLNKAVKLSWITAQEINSKEFIVERSANGTTWFVIATIPAAGNSNTMLSYTTNDNSPLNGINFYRIRQVDMDNKFDYSVTRSVLFNSGSEVLITPNPARDMINIYMNNDSRRVNIQLLDVSGKLVRSLDSDQSFVQITTATLSRGIYYVKLVDGKNVSVSKVFLQ